MCNKDLTVWFADLAISVDRLMIVCRTILSLYALWKDFDDRTQIAQLLKKIPSPHQQQMQQNNLGQQQM
jgi:hypothetical protein